MNSTPLKGQHILCSRFCNGAHEVVAQPGDVRCASDPRYVCKATLPENRNTGKPQVCTEAQKSAWWSGKRSM